MTGISTLDGAPGVVRYMEALFPGEPEAVTNGLDFDWDANYKEEYAARALELAKALVHDKIAPGGEIMEDSFVDGRQVAYGTPDLFALDAKIHMRDGASYVVQYLMPSERISSFSIYPLGWHSAMWGYTDPAEEKEYPSLDGSWTWDDANAYTEERNGPPEGQADIPVTEAMYEAIAKAAEGMIGASIPFEAPNVDEQILPGIYEYTFIRMVQDMGYPAEATFLNSLAEQAAGLDDALLKRGRLIMLINEDGTKSRQGIWLGEDCYAYANYETGLVERKALTEQDFEGENRVRIDTETTLRVSADSSIASAPTPTPEIS